MEPITMAIMASIEVSKAVGTAKTAKAQRKLIKGQMEINKIVADVNKSQLETQKNLAIKNQMKQFEKVAKESEKMYARNVSIIASSGQKRASSAARGAMDMPKADYYSNAQQIVDNVETIKTNALLGQRNIDIQTSSKNLQLTSSMVGVGQQSMNQMLGSMSSIAMMLEQVK